MALTEQSRRRELINLSVPVVAATIDGNVYIAQKPTRVKSVRWAVATGASGATADLKKCTGTTAPASGTTVLASTIDLNATANTVTEKALTTTDSNRVLAAGDRLALDVSGTLTGASTVIQIQLETL